MHLIDCIVSVVSKNRLQNHYSRVSQPLSTFNNQMCWFLTTGFRSFHFKFCLTAWRKSETDILSSRLATNKRQRQYYFFSSFNYGFKELSQTACDSKEHLLTSLRSQFKITYSVCSFLLGIFFKYLYLETWHLLAAQASDQRKFSPSKVSRYTVF